MIIKASGEYINVSAPEKTLPLKLKFGTPSFNRDGDTQALPDGYINISYGK